jgi:hypothetical protein
LRPDLTQHLSIFPNLHPEIGAERFGSYLTRASIADALEFNGHLASQVSIRFCSNLVQGNLGLTNLKGPKILFFVAGILLLLGFLE